MTNETATEIEIPKSLIERNFYIQRVERFTMWLNDALEMHRHYASINERQRASEHLERASVLLGVMSTYMARVEDFDSKRRKEAWL